MSDDSILPHSGQLLYLNVTVSEKGLTELSGNKRIIFIPKDQIQSVEIKFGYQAERPFVQGTLGLVLTVLGIIGINMIAKGGWAMLLERWAVGFVFFGGLGAWLFWEALRRGYYLRVICSNDTRNLALKGAVRKADWSSFIKSASQFGYIFRDCASS